MARDMWFGAERFNLISERTNYERVGNSIASARPGAHRNSRECSRQCSPRRPSNTIRIFSSAEYCRRVARRTSLIAFSALSFLFVIIVTHERKDEPNYSLIQTSLSVQLSLMAHILHMFGPAGSARFHSLRADLLACPSPVPPVSRNPNIASGSIMTAQARRSWSL